MLHPQCTDNSSECMCAAGFTSRCFIEEHTRRAPFAALLQVQAFCEAALWP